jgi:ubiquitin C-terminal hydrolase
LNLNKPFTSTEELTKAFGWKSSHVYFEQHDVQELTRVLFDVFGKSIKKTEHKDILDILYRGKTVNKIKCLTCGYTSERIEEFIDIPLFLKDIVTQTQYHNIYESLRKYLEEEDLVGDIQYACDTCQKKVDAKKTIFIRNLPPLLMFSVNRFDYDWQRVILLF